MKKEATKRQKDLLSVIYRYIKDAGFPPTIKEMREALGVSSNQSVIDLLHKLQNSGLIKKGEGSARSISLLPVAYQVLEKPPLVPFLGVTAAGAPLAIEEITGEWQAVSQEVSRLKDEVFLLKISGDSMINAGINDGDVVLVKQDKYFTSGEIVLARIGSEATVKRFMSVDTPPYLYLKPENPKYDILYFTEEVMLEGKVISVLNRGQWRPLT